MDYPLENLGPDRFQALCQSLLAKCLPELQCFPIFQSDGGRDALLPSEGKSEKCVVFQVKFLHNPDQKAPHEHLLRLLRQEATKIKNLSNSGVKKYYLITNIRGTGKRDSGSIDTVSKILEKLPIPAQCWWRDDICRRLDDAWNVKLSFPEVLRNTDFIRLMTEGTGGEEHRRRVSALRAFIEDQYERDKELRFNQIELRSEILDLFIDVPVEFPAYAGRGYATEDRFAGRKNTVENILARIAAESSHHDIDDPEPFDYGRPPPGPRLGAASFLLHPLTQGSGLQLVIEGAPGQGKSTIAQYVCQVHRHILLNRPDGRIDSKHNKASVRLPFRIECRDLAVWLTGEWPFGYSEDVPPKEYHTRSVESYLAAQLSTDSGGVSFSVDDLIAILKLIPVLIFYDGLDEVADIKRRRDVVEAIIRGTNRIRRNAQSLLTVVTSRPAVFANSPGLPENAFPRIQLAPIGKTAISEYAERWLKALKLSPRESEDVRGVLDSKLDQTHIRELAKNPMQLSILLSLIRSHGSSLPEMRTALYDSYVERSFNREAEKSLVVRDNRSLFVEIHHYVAWILHTEAETSNTHGRIQEGNLRALVQTYLTVMGHEDVSVEDLFSGMVERIVALVSRVEGTFEFEVQPLREYFVAKYLYVTARYSPPGRKMGGTKPDRFNAIARNFFWQNVTRFYAGCYDQGELPALVDSLDMLAHEQGYRDTGYPQALAATLLADRVFTQLPRVMKHVISMILDGIGLRQIASSNYSRGDLIRLASGCGSQELVNRCFQLLLTQPAEDFRQTLIQLIKANSTLDERLSHWKSQCTRVAPDDLTMWMEYGLNLGVLTNLPERDIERYLVPGADERLWLVACAGRGALVERDKQRLQAVVDLLLGGQYFQTFVGGEGLVCNFESVLSPWMYMIAFRERSAESLEDCWARYFDLFASEKYVQGGGGLERRCKDFVALSFDLSREYSTLDWSTTLEPWKKLTSKGRRDFGDRWAWLVIANIAAAIRSSSEKGAVAASLFDESVDLCERVRYARLQSGAWRWWEAQIGECRGSATTSFALLVFFSWAGKSALAKLANVVDRQLCSLGSNEWMRLQRALSYNEMMRYHLDARWLSIDLKQFPRSLSERFAVAISPRVKPQGRLELYKNYVDKYRGEEICTLEFCQSVALYALRNSPKEWSKWVSVVSRTYSHGVAVGQFAGYGIWGDQVSKRMPNELIDEVIRNSGSYPLDLVGAVYDMVRTKVASKAKPLSHIAREDGWFDDGK